MSQYAVIFDMDGVICHTNPYHAKAFEAFFNKYNIESSEQEFQDHMYGKHNSYIMSYFFKRPVEGEELLRLEFEKEDMFRQIYKSEITPIARFPEFLDELKQEGFKTAVATSAPKANLDLIVEGLQFGPKMESMLSSENVTKHKPDPQVYLLTAERLGVYPSQCLVFEDSYSGISAALNAGMKVVGVLSSHTREQLPPCDAYISDYTEITAQKVKELINS
ncbi:HAD family phosphatase [Sphingobacterium spiritivorum]|uniref:HAD hydrolase, family IA, variant 3 n=1 Tax=Sphingobacterium spiritivorum ATCC 33861 TaxID=525373 RepID=D7VMH9_SPHSI|nr:HAD family phosphatase [Sphingobacterium spiritivorum]EFK58184.1 HAD hydrolase, family IA, variant 3 [Sphingobacterium spiritivorum ATCC 33861]QQT34564.1 HAD family phosphatase [Sphingobacterium spiritivorum]WQD35441.1 HAD family phosphatase [Sphingobacterium spiritivorum]SUJ00405.1 Phosphatase YqaB [Sphingobacterium spiritivorum]